VDLAVLIPFWLWPGRYMYVLGLYWATAYYRLLVAKIQQSSHNRLTHSLVLCQYSPYRQLYRVSCVFEDHDKMIVHFGCLYSPLTVSSIGSYYVNTPRVDLSGVYVTWTVTVRSRYLCASMSLRQGYLTHEGMYSDTKDT
jgi:hypothetical protein